MFSADLTQPRFSTDPADQAVGRGRRRAHDSAAQQAAAALSQGADRLAGDAGDRRAAGAQSRHHQCHRISAPGMVGAVAAGAVCQRGAADRHAARRRIRSGARSAGPIAQRRIRLRLRRAGADRLRPAARRAVEGLAAQNPRRRAQARLAGRARRQLARLYASLAAADARYPSGRALSALRRAARARRRRRRFFVSDPAGSDAPASTLCWTITRSPKRSSSSWRRAPIGKPNNGAATASPRWRGIFWKEIRRGADRIGPRARGLRGSRASSRPARSISPAKPR